VLSPATPAFSLTAANSKGVIFNAIVSLNIFEYKKSIKQLMDESPLAKYNYKEVAKQFDDIYKLIENNNVAVIFKYLTNCVKPSNKAFKFIVNWYDNIIAHL
jgi:hypothetical protein